MTREETKELLLHILMTYEPKDQYGDYDDTEPYEQALTMAIEALSADAVEVVRCKDCKDSRVYGKTTQWLACESVMEGRATDPDGYCYLGKRREESEVEE